MKHLITILVLGTILLSSCGEEHKAEIQEVEKLQHELAMNADVLRIDIAIFEERVEQMEQNRKRLEQFYTDTVSLEEAQDFDKYKAIWKIYRGQIQSYDHCVAEQMELESQLANLRKDLENDLMGKQEFKQHLHSEREDVVALVEKSKDVKKRLYEVEPEYIRLEQMVQTALATLKD